MADVVLLGGDVWGCHKSTNGGKSFVPQRDGQNTSDKLRMVGYCRDGDTIYAMTVGFSKGDTGATGTGVKNNRILKSTLGDDGSLSAWSELAQLEGAWSAGDNGAVLGDSYATKSGHPRQTGRMITIDSGRGLFYVASWDGLWRCKKDGTGIARIWGAGNAVTAVVLDPSDPTTAYVTVDTGPKAGVWKLTGINGGTVGETGWTGSSVPYPQCVAVVKTSTGLHLFVTTGKRVNSTAAARTWAVAYLAPGKAFASGWRDITGVIGDDIGSGSMFLSAGLDAIEDGGAINIAVGHSNDGTGDGGGGTRVAWAYGFTGTGVPAWERPVGAKTSYNLGNDPAKPWWFQHKQPTFMLDKPGFDTKSVAFVDKKRVIFGGRSGAWMHDHVLDKNFPVIEGVQGTYAYMPFCHPTDGLKGWFGDHDWNIIRWANGPWGMPLMKPGDSPLAGSPSGQIAWGGSVTPGGRVSISSGEGGKGQTHVTADLWVTAPTYINETTTGSNQPPTTENRGSLMWGSGTSQRLVVAVQGSGLWLKDGSGGSGAWVLKDAKVKVEGSQTRLLTAANGDYGLICDQAYGLLRTTDQGATWSTLLTGGSGGRDSGHVAADLTVAGRFLHVRNSKLYEVTAAGVVNDITPTGVRAASAVATWVKGGVLWTAVADGTKIWLKKGSGAWADMTRQSLRHATSGVIRGIAFTAHGVLVIACQGGYSCYLLDPDATL